MSDDRVVGFMCSRTARPGNRCHPITEHDLAVAHAVYGPPDGHGPPEQVRGLAEYPCPGRCGCWVADGNVPCLACWYTANPLDAATLRARHLPADHPRAATSPPVLSPG